MDEALARLTEPYAPRPSLRIGAVQELRAAGLEAGVSLSPILPLINDSKASIAQVFGAARAADALWVWHNLLFLRSCARAVFFPFLEEHFPHLIRRYRDRYSRGDFLTGAYVELIRARVESARVEHGFPAPGSRERMPAARVHPQQLSIPWAGETSTA
jgi:DNA repair photolyase